MKVKNDIPLTTPVKTPFPLLGTNLKGLFSLSFRQEHRRTGRGRGARGAAAPHQFWATQFFGAARKKLGKASF